MNKKKTKHKKTEEDEEEEEDDEEKERRTTTRTRRTRRGRRRRKNNNKNKKRRIRHTSKRARVHADVHANVRVHLCASALNQTIDFGNISVDSFRAWQTSKKLFKQNTLL
jgi:hypothetical protein